MSAQASPGWAEILPGHIPAVQVLERLVLAGWPGIPASAWLTDEGRRFLPQLFDASAAGDACRAFLARELAEDAPGVRARLAFLRGAMRDVALHGDLLFADPDAFMARAGTFALFDYSRAACASAEAQAAIRPWVDYLATLTRAEAPVLLPLLDLPPGARILEPGGNSGAFARAVIAGHAPAAHVVFDLPAVCALGRMQGGGVRFAAGDMRRPDWRSQAGITPDVVLFKSVLHDWPEPEAAALLGHALAALAPGGRLILAERAAFSGMATGSALDYGNLVFAPFYRSPEIYRRLLAKIRPGLTIRLTPCRIDMDWFVLTATRAA